jgi:hypothetical protein
MIFGMTAATYTFVHVLLSLMGIGSGFIVLLGLISGKRMDRWTMLFLTTTVATSLTGFGFPNEHITPGQVVGGISLVVLAIAIFSRYSRDLTGAWGSTYVVCASIALYLNVFVAVVQSFEKVPALKALAPTQTEPPFVVAQLIVLASFAALGSFAAIRFRRLSLTSAVG